MPESQSIRLSTIGSRNVTVTVDPCVLDDSRVSLRLGLSGDNLAIAFTESEARWLAQRLAAVLGDAQPP